MFSRSIRRLLLHRDRNFPRFAHAMSELELALFLNGMVLVDVLFCYIRACVFALGWSPRRRGDRAGLLLPYGFGECDNEAGRPRSEPLACASRFR